MMSAFMVEVVSITNTKSETVGLRGAGKLPIKKKKRKEKQQMVTNIVLQAIWSFWKLLNVAPVVL